MSPPLSEDDEVLAAELALGLLDGAERGQAEARLVHDAGFAAAHGRWQSWAAAMFADPGEAPRAAVWDAIQARLPRETLSDERPDAGNVISFSRGGQRFWQAAALAATVAAIALGVVAYRNPAQVLVRVPVAQAPSAPMVAVLTGKQGVVTVSFDARSGRLTSAPSGLDLDGHSPELWVIPADGKPRSLGVMDAKAPNWIKTPAAGAAALAAGVTLAVSVEPIGGSPTGQPTGPVILTGKLVAT
jgi:anti-sigma-K factor RskA